jgi:hypothetical protein
MEVFRRRRISVPLFRFTSDEILDRFQPLGFFFLKPET